MERRNRTVMFVAAFALVASLAWAQAPGETVVAVNGGGHSNTSPTGTYTYGAYGRTTPNVGTWQVGWWWKNESWFEVGSPSACSSPTAPPTNSGGRCKVQKQFTSTGIQNIYLTAEQISGACGTQRVFSQGAYSDGTCHTLQTAQSTATADCVGCPPSQCPSPIVVPFGKSPEVKFTEPVIPFDLDGDGAIEITAWPEPSDGGWLVLDRDGDGMITSGRELFGNVTRAGVTDGFQVLAQDVAGVGVASATETPVYFAKLKVWRDANLNGITDPGELEPASRYLRVIYMLHEACGKKDPYGTTYRRKGLALYADGERRPLYDVVPARLTP